MNCVRCRSKDFPDIMIQNVPCLVTDISIEQWPLLNYIQSPTGFRNCKFVNELGSEVIDVHDVSQGCKVAMEIAHFASELHLGKSLYAKDWHLFQMCSTRLYKTPEPFRDDWLNWYWRNCRKNDDDYRFVYIGGRGTKTYVHHDVICSFSWSMNIQGRKRWYLWSPADVSRLYSPHHHVLVADARPGQYDANTFPFVADTRPVIVEQEVGEAMFVPSGWYHMVENLGMDSGCGDGGNGSTCDRNGSDGSETDGNSPVIAGDADITVSLNHNWINGYNVYESWRFLLRELCNVRREIWNFAPSVLQRAGGGVDAVDESMLMEEGEWYRHCELLLRANAAMGVVEFLRMVCARMFVLVAVKEGREGRGGEAGGIAGQCSSMCERLLSCLQVNVSDLLNQGAAAAGCNGKNSESDEDESVLDLLCSHSVSAPPEYATNFLSCVLSCGGDRITGFSNSVADILIPLTSRWPVHTLDDNGTEKPRSVTGLQYVCRQVLAILDEVMQSALVKIHIAYAIDGHHKACRKSTGDDDAYTERGDRNDVHVVIAEVEGGLTSFKSALETLLYI